MKFFSFTSCEDSLHVTVLIFRLISESAPHVKYLSISVNFNFFVLFLTSVADFFSVLLAAREISLFSKSD
jgi:hypothetical protein